MARSSTEAMRITGPLSSCAVAGQEGVDGSGDAAGEGLAEQRARRSSRQCLKRAKARSPGLCRRVNFPRAAGTQCLRREGMSLLVSLPDLQRGQAALVRMLPQPLAVMEDLDEGEGTSTAKKGPAAVLPKHEPVLPMLCRSPGRRRQAENGERATFSSRHSGATLWVVLSASMNAYTALIDRSPSRRRPRRFTAPRPSRPTRGRVRAVGAVFPPARLSSAHPAPPDRGQPVPALPGSAVLRR
ncbi:hypothetical protein RKD28_007278 [Streptomyces sp. SAI-229]